MVFALWLLMASIIWALSKVTSIDGITYRFVGLFGLVAALDWLLILVVGVLQCVALCVAVCCSVLWCVAGSGQGSHVRIRVCV